MSEEVPITETEKPRKKRRLLKFFLVLGGILLVFQILFYFGSDLLLRNYLKEKVYQASGNKYEIDFDTFRILFIQRGITFVGLKINPVEGQFDSLAASPYYRAAVKDVTVKGLNYLFRKKEIVVGDIELVGPQLEFKFVQSEKKDSIPGQSPLEVLRQEIRKSFLSSQINEIRIKQIAISDADLLLKDFISQKSIQAENTFFRLKDIQIMQERSPATPFNADGFEFGFDNFAILLADSVHTIKAAQIRVSSLDQFIEAKDVHIQPDFSKFSTSYFSIDLDDIKLVDADINRVFYTSEVKVGELLLRRPNFNIVSREVQKTAAEPKQFDLYSLIDGILNSVEIRDFEIVEGSFRKRNLSQAQGEYRIKAERIDFQMADFYVGPDESRKVNQFFYAEDASVSLREFELALSDSIHWIKGEYVKLSSFEDNIRIEGLQLFPVQFAEMPRARNILDIEVSELMINNANLKKTYNESVLDMEEVVLVEPKIVLKDLQGKKKNPSDASVSLVFQEYLKGVYFKRFEIRDGSLVMDNRLKIRQDSLSFGKVNLLLENFALDENTENSEGRSFFLADNLHLEFEDYALKLADNLHFFKANRLSLDTKKQEIIIDGFSIKPPQNVQTKAVLETYGKNSVLDIFVPKFEAKGVDIVNAYFEGILHVKQINVPRPQISIKSFKPTETDSAAQDAMTRQEIADLLTNYFDEVRVDSLSLFDGTMSLESSSTKGTQSFSDKDIDLGIKNFHVQKGADFSNMGFLFSEEVDLQLNRYIFNIADGKYTMDAERINFNSANEEIIARNVKVRPRQDLNEKLKISATIPTMLFRGVDLERFLFENQLGLQKLELDDALVNILINDDVVVAETPSRKRRTRTPALPKTIDVIQIDTITAKKAQLFVSIRDGGVQKELVNTGINLNFFDFYLDSATIRKKDFVGMFSGVTLGAEEFWLTLADSVHRVTFKNVQFDTRREAIFLQSFRVIPNNLSGKPGIPVFSGHIPAVLIKTKSLEALQKGKEISLLEVSLFRPDMEVFVDQQKAPPKNKEKQVSETAMFESLTLADFRIVEGKFGVLDKNTGAEPVFLKGLNVSLADIFMDLTGKENFDPKSLLKNDFEVSWSDYQILLKDSLNKIKIGNIKLNNRQAEIRDLEFLPRIGKYEYARRIGVQTDVAHISVGNITLERPDYEKYLADKTLVAKSLKLQGVEAAMFRDKRFPKVENVFKPMPQQMMKEAGLALRLDTLTIEDGFVRYEEFPDKGMVPGYLEFSDISAAFFPFYVGVESGQEYPLEESFLIANATLNGEAKLNMQGHLFYHQPYPMRINAQLGEFRVGILNSILKSNAFASARDGRILNADWSFEANDDEAIGKMTFLYEDLNVQLLDERTLTKGKGMKPILTFVINTFAVKSKNPRGFQRKPINASIYQVRDKEKFIFNYWWKTTFSGIKGSLGLGQAKKPREKKTSAQKPPVK
jgi:hypothetical protein